MSEQFNTEHTKEAICPYCGHVVRDSWLEIGSGEECDTEHTCNACGATYDVRISLVTAYTTRKQEEKP